MSWSEAHKKLPSGKYAVQFFDEEGYTNLRKVRFGLGRVRCSGRFLSQKVPVLDSGRRSCV